MLKRCRRDLVRVRKGCWPCAGWRAGEWTACWGQPVAVVSVTHMFKERFVDRQRIRRQCSYVAHLTLWTAGKKALRLTQRKRWWALFYSCVLSSETEIVSIYSPTFPWVLSVSSITSCNTSLWIWETVVHVYLYLWTVLDHRYNIYEIWKWA